MTDFTQNVNHQDTSDNHTTDPTPRHPDSRLKAEWLFLYEQLPPDQWFNADYMYKTSGWLSIHADIRKRQHMLTQISDAYIADSIEWSEYRAQTLPRITQYIAKLHQHHNIEDTGYFPQFIRMYPQLKSGFDVLDRDHVYLDGLLNDLEALNRRLAIAEVEDQALSKQMHDCLREVTALLSQHLSDEEDLVIPILGLH